MDYKHLDYQLKNLLPGLHVFTTKRLSEQTAVPILVHDQQVVYGSSSIISYLDEKFPERSLTPKENQLQQQALKWENYVDTEIGIHIRRCFYHVLLEHPQIVIPLLTHNGPWYGKLLLTAMYPKLKIRMKKGMQINKVTAEQSKEHLRIAIDKLYDHLQVNSFVVGNQFTRADLAAASLLAPLSRPESFGLNWPDNLPESLGTLISELNDKTRWVNELYEKYR